jgi:hypothetical protein
MFRDRGNPRTQFAIKGCGEQPNEAVGGGANLIFAVFPLGDLGSIGVKVMAHLIPVQPETLAKESELFAGKPCWAIRECLGNRAVNFSHPWNDHIGSPAFRTLGHFNAL